jgi:HSP20 family protein
MVEKTTPFTGWWPDLYQPLRAARERIADWFAPASEASSNDDA